MNDFTSVFFLNLDWKPPTAQMTSSTVETGKVSSRAPTAVSMWLAALASVNSELEATSRASMEGREGEAGRKVEPCRWNVVIRWDLLLLESANAG